jgi:hypothetical protein
LLRFAGFEFELLGQVFGVLALQDRVGRAAARTVGRVAGAAHLRGQRLSLGKVGFGRCARFGGDDGQRQRGGQQESNGRLHAVNLEQRGRQANPRILQ